MDVNRKITPSKLRPCDACRALHLKCTYNVGDTCQRCSNTRRKCVRTRNSIRFSNRTITEYDDALATHKQLQKPQKSALKYVDETEATIASYRDEDMDEERGNNVDIPVSYYDEASGQQPPASTLPLQPEINSRPTTANADVALSMDSSSGHHNQFDSSTISTSLVDEMAKTTLFTTSPNSFVSNVTFGIEKVSTNGGYEIGMGTPISTTRTGSIPFASDHIQGELDENHFQNTSSYSSKADPLSTPTAHLEAALLRYFVDELARWFDICDPDTHFSTVVPQRARGAGPLRSALLTVSARHVARLQAAGRQLGKPGIHFPRVTEDVAVQYHSECVRNLLRLSLDPEAVHDVDLLVASVILRTDEELDSRMDEDYTDNQVFLKVTNMFMEAQIPPAVLLPHSSPEICYADPLELSPSENNNFRGTESGLTGGHSPLNVSLHQSPNGIEGSDQPARTSKSSVTNGLRQSCFWVAIRQEILASFMLQRPVQFPLSRCNGFRQLTPAIDAVWAYRMITFCADVLEFCYGSQSSDGEVAPASSDHSRWAELQRHSKGLVALLPPSFEPIFRREADPALDEVFPQAWYLHSCHANGLSYIELAKILLAVFDPTRPRLGHGFAAANRQLVMDIQQIVKRLCGIAVGNQQSPPNLINACMGIAMFGEFFENAHEQNALLGILQIMMSEYAYPVGKTVEVLKNSWNVK